MNVDIFTCKHFCELAKNGHFVRIYIRVFEIIVYIWHNKSYFHDVHIFADISETRKKKRENMYSTKMSTFTVNVPGFPDILK